MIINLKKENELGRKKLKLPIPVVDLFAGPGGLGEGFSAVGRETGDEAFRICLSIEKDIHAHQTLELRSFFSQFHYNSIPEEYYEHIRGQIPREELYSKYPKETQAAKKRARRAELGKEKFSKIDGWIAESLRGARTWVLIGGPPCQAYSMAGRARNRSKEGYVPEDDDRHYLYEEYLRIICGHWPSVFVMENVPGLLSTKLKGGPIFDRIRSDLSDPATAKHSPEGTKTFKYSLFSLVKRSESGITTPSDFIVKCEDYGIPQARHRVIILGIREDLNSVSPDILTTQNKTIPIKDVLNGLPQLRSGFSKGNDDHEKWIVFLKDARNQEWMKELKNRGDLKTYSEAKELLSALKAYKHDRGNEFIRKKAACKYLPEWYLDDRIKGVCNHSTRGHIDLDIYRYFFIACYARAHGKSPTLDLFPKQILPKHRNVQRAIEKSLFSDRFRVQLEDHPSKTITSHISKDGHYFIHYDPAQCRSLTVREAARIQTFPDNYFFCGGRTEQYSQVGNAVPPLLAKQIGQIVLDFLKRAEYG